MQNLNQIQIDQYGRAYVQHYNQYDSKGNLISVGGRMMISSNQKSYYTIKN